MKHQTFTFILILTLLFNSKLVAQWESLGDDIIPLNHRVWSIKVAPDKSVWAIATFDAFPPANQIPKVFRSTDEGNTWTNSEIPEAISNYGWDISPVDSNKAYIALGRAGLYETINGGLNWTKVESYLALPTSAMLVHFFNEDDGLVLGRDSTGIYPVISVTSDSGENWIQMGGSDLIEPSGTSLPPFTSGLSLGFFYSVNSSYDYRGNTIMIGLNSGNYWVSYDKGYSWTEGETPLNDLGILLSNIAMKDENTFVVAGDTDFNFNGQTTVNFTTRDGGTTWTQGNSVLTSAATHYIPNSDSIFIMVGHNDFSWGSEGTAISYDYGENWEILDDTRIIALDFADENTGYGTCCNNIWQTANGQIHKWNFDLPTSTFEIVRNNTIRIIPNPVHNNLSLLLNDEFQSRELIIEIFSVSGRIMYSNKAEMNKQINITTANLPKGIYSLKIKGDHKIVTKKFIKE